MLVDPNIFHINVHFRRTKSSLISFNMFTAIRFKGIYEQASVAVGWLIGCLIGRGMQLWAG